jgi:hypothetical protein
MDSSAHPEHHKIHKATNMHLTGVKRVSNSYISIQLDLAWMTSADRSTGRVFCIHIKMLRQKMQEGKAAPTARFGIPRSQEMQQ